MTTENLDDGAGNNAPASDSASTQNHAAADVDVPSASSPTTSRLETPEERLARKLAADSEASQTQSNGDTASPAASAEIAASVASVGADATADDSTSVFEAKAAATAMALRKEGSGRTTTSSGRRRSSQISHCSMESDSRPGAYRVRGNSGGFDDDDEEESKQEVEYVGSRAKLATDDAVLVGTKLATMTNEGEDEEYTVHVANNVTSRTRGSINSSLKSSTKSNKDVLIPEAFVVEEDGDIERGQDDSTVPVIIPMTTAEVVETKTVCGFNLPTHTWKLLAGAVLGVLALVAIVVGSLAGTGKIGGETQVSSFGTDQERPVVLDCPATKLVAADGAEEDKFGRAVAIDSGVAVVGAFLHSDPSQLEANITKGGAAYVYEKVAEEWTLMTKSWLPVFSLSRNLVFPSQLVEMGLSSRLGRTHTTQLLGACFCSQRMRMALVDGLGVAGSTLRLKKAK